ncbi:grpIintron_endo, group I intron endonuclease [uncultured Caudovirales phage]|uniref:GrpIintron_endo, group I intron endonuclease n=1 Tax=uncultured Caudovirales phage TaxID=2100421 RepID=A0A6J5KUX8_9CAUD|nr:grpIintron_endo, group I intron endonuclease [uncultured Caudovirales phage]CAB5208753.1 grpIintron_endo, group I intron endonuclease [uncultured Caudovirales phage]
MGIHKTKSLEDGYMGSGKLLKRAMQKHGIHNFKKDIVEFFDTELEMVQREQEIVTEEFIAKDSNYNIMPGGRFGSKERNGLTFEGYNHTQEVKEKLRQSSTGRTHSDITKKKISENNFARRNPIKQKEHASVAGSYVKSESHKQKIRESITQLHQEHNYNLGKIRIKVTCPHCNKEGANNTMSRWHFDNCKNKTILS